MSDVDLWEWLATMAQRGVSESYASGSERIAMRERVTVLIDAARGAAGVPPLAEARVAAARVNERLRDDKIAALEASLLSLTDGIHRRLTALESGRVGIDALAGRVDALERALRVGVTLAEDAPDLERRIAALELNARGSVDALAGRLSEVEAVTGNHAGEVQRRLADLERAVERELPAVDAHVERRVCALEARGALHHRWLLSPFAVATLDPNDIERAQRGARVEPPHRIDPPPVGPESPHYRETVEDRLEARHQPLARHPSGRLVEPLCVECEGGAEGGYTCPHDPGA